jgi:coenzyme F420-reducing hydrogenase delta subunit
VEQTRKLLERVGLPGQRLQMINISSAMAGQFAFAAAELTAEVQRLGPSPLRPGSLPAEVIAEAEAAGE